MLNRNRDSNRDLNLKTYKRCLNIHIKDYRLKVVSICIKTFIFSFKTWKLSDLVKQGSKQMCSEE